MSMIMGIDRQAVWSYLFGTSDPPESAAVAQERLEHLHWDRGSRSWVAAEVARDQIAA
ncbi:MAG TPA: hypothetical protein VIN32_05190 [Candidatus Limnocylindria bacterium]